MDAREVAERFGLGSLAVEPQIAATGWGERNRVWRFETDRGVFAVKEVIPELVPDDSDEAFRIESLAHDGGVSMPTPVRSVEAACFERVGGCWYRCHRWVTGTAKQNEDTTRSDAAAMGAVVAALHGQQIPVVDTPPTHRFGEEHWLGLARAGGDRSWARLLEQQLEQVLRVERLGASVPDEEPVGSHRDLNAHNVLFSRDGPVLIDWDGAGPISARSERASTAVLWSQRRDGTLDREQATAFLRSYREGGGVVDRDDPDALVRWLNGLTAWTERNVQIALRDPTEHQDQLATGLVTALANGTSTVATRQTFLTDVISRL